MELLRHQPRLREDDGEYIYSRCGLMNPGDDDACIPINLEPVQGKDEKKPHNRPCSVSTYVSTAEGPLATARL